ncbi:hypothetical protein [Microbacterium enclense]|uniref:hypothetical protein n=1 Tax=Microbacterium enclense TaxID=993073 RepID=UPI00343BB4A3
MMQPTQLPDAAALSAAATGISSCLAQFDAAITELTHGWSGLAGSYSAPEDEVVLTAFDRLGPLRDDLVTLAEDAGRALEDYGAIVAGLATRRAALRTLIGGIVGGVVGGVVGGEIGKGIGEWAMGLFGGDE